MFSFEDKNDLSFGSVAFGFGDFDHHTTWSIVKVDIVFVPQRFTLSAK
jgi:hypothetical protein